MPPNSEIEKLERRWRENPKGTVFAPYAEVLRKNGDHPLAREVLRQGLELHPDHIPGNIVLGRCCLDLGEDGPAEAAFTHVLELDGENVIALKALADITERQGRLMEASRWLTRLVAVDPSNDEARDQLSRVELAREAAAAVITGQITAQAGHPAPPDTEPPAEPEFPSAAEVGSGVIGESGEYRAPEPPASPITPAAPVAAVVPPDEAETVPAFPVLTPPRVHEIETMELDLAAAAQELHADAPDGMMVDEPFTPDAASAPTAPPMPVMSPHGLTIAAEESHGPIDLRPSGSTEFQAPDAAAELLDLKPSLSEFQVPDAAADLAIKSAGGSEYQTPSGAEELLASAEQPAPAPPAPPPPPAEPELEPEGAGVADGATTEGQGSWAGLNYPPDIEAVSQAPTAELQTRLTEPPPPAPLADLPLVDLEEQAPAEAAAEPEAPTEPPVAEAPASSLEPAVAAAEPMGADAPAAGAVADLPLIFPDAPAAEPPRRRVSQEAMTRPEAATAEPEIEAEADTGAPPLVVTETMAELYVRQGHLEDAAQVYRTLLARLPGDARLEERLRQVEAAQQSGRRRHSYLATDTGGESVESFFRALTTARPGSTGATPLLPAPGEGPGDAPAPTRPASDPLSLSAIFGEDPAPAAARSAPPPPSPPARPPGDAFSFDQFFGVNAPGGPSPTIRPSGAQAKDEDLDQFQHWLKSLKR